MSDDFTALLQALNSGDNEIRQTAEDKYASLDAKQKLQLLVPAAADNQLQDPHRALAAVLLRRTITGQWEECWDPLSTDQREQFKGGLIQLLSTVVDPNSSSVLRKRISDCVAELARKLIELADDSEDENNNHPWQELLQFLFQCAQSGKSGGIETALNLIYQCPTIFGSQLEKYSDVLRNLLGQCMAPTQTLDLRGLSVKCVCNLITDDPDSSTARKIQAIIPQLIATVSEYSRDQGSDVLQAVVELQEAVPKFLKPATAPVLDMCLQLAEDQNVEEDVRAMAVESCVTLGESLPGAIRKKVPEAIGKLCLVCLSLMQEIEDDESWAAKTVPEDDDDDLPNLTVIGESSLDRIARSLGGSTVLRCIAPRIAELLQTNRTWQEKRAALLALSAIAEGTVKSIKAILPQLVPAMLPFLQDPHPRVRHAACNCVGQLSTDLSPEMQKLYHSEILQSLVPVLDDNICRVRTHAGAALVNFIDDAPKEVIMPYLEPLCQKLSLVLQQHLQSTGPFMVLEQLCTTVAAVADKVETDFRPQYARFIPNLRTLLQATENAKAPANDSDPDLRLLRGKAIECVSLIGLAVGKDMFLTDAHEIMQHLVNTQQDVSSWTDDDPQISYMISAWARMCQILGEEFHKYLPIVMGPLMRAASFKPQVQLVDPEEADEQKENDNWEFVNLGGGQSFGIATAGLEEKATACQMLVCYAKELGGQFEQYIEEVTKLMVPLLKFYFHDSVRCSAAQSIGPLVNCTFESKGKQAAVELWKYAFDEILESLDAEPENEITGFSLGAVAEVAEILGKQFLIDEEHASKLFKIIGSKLREHLDRSDERIKARNDEDYDEETEEDLQIEDEEDSFVLQKVSDVIHNGFGLNKQSLLPYFAEYLKSPCTDLVKPKRAWTDRQWGLCVWDDIIEFGGQDSWQYSDSYLPALARGINDRQPEVRQAASYGVGILAQYGPWPQAVESLSQFMSELAKVIEGPMGRGDSDPEQIESTENAISAAAKIMQHRPDAAPLNIWLERWINWLPVYRDKEESANCYSFIAHLLENGHESVQGHSEKLLYLAAQSLTSDALEDASNVQERIINICRTAKDSNPNLWKMVTQNLSNLPEVLRS